MRRRWIFYSAILCSVVAALVGGAATAAARPVPQEVFPPSGFRLQGTNGFTISVSAFRAGLGFPAGILLTARRGNEYVAYGGPAKVSEDSIRADLGSLGRVALKLERSGQVETAHPKCTHLSAEYEAGTWVGAVEFHGEAGYTRARATSVTALPGFAVEDSPEISPCGQSTGDSFSSKLPGAELRGVSFAGGRTIKFQVNKNRRRGRTVFTATLGERLGGIRIYRYLRGVSPADAFRYDRRVKTATLSPPAPFSGAAHLRRSRDSLSPIWTGNLALAFPGRTVALAGPSVHVSLRHARLTHGNDSGLITGGI